MTDWQPIDTAPPAPDRGEMYYVESEPFLLLFNGLTGPTVYRARHIAVSDSEEYGPEKSFVRHDGETVKYRHRRAITTRRFALNGGGSVEEGNPNLAGWLPEPTWMGNVRINIR